MRHFFCIFQKFCIFAAKITNQQNAKSYEHKTHAPPVTVCLSNCYDEQEQKLFKLISEVYELEESKIIRQDGTKNILKVVLTFDDFQQIYASLLVELERQMREISDLPQRIQQLGADIQLHKWYQDTQLLLNVIQDFREAERDYLPGRLALSRSLLFNKAGKEA